MKRHIKGHMEDPEPCVEISITNPAPCGDIEWCGQIWTEEEQRLGVTKCIYPMTKWEKFVYKIKSSVVRFLEKIGLKKKEVEDE